jgi:hypothetical protein
LERCAVIGPLTPLALSRLVCAFGPHSLVTVLPRWGLPRPVSCLADEKHRRGRTAQGSLPTSVCGRVLLSELHDPAWQAGSESDVILLVRQLGGFCKQPMVMVCWRPTGWRQRQIGPWAAQRRQGLDGEAVVMMNPLDHAVACIRRAREATGSARHGQGAPGAMHRAAVLAERLCRQ